MNELKFKKTEGEQLLVLKENVELKDLEKYGFTLTGEPEYGENGDFNYKILARKRLGSGELTIETDERFRQLTIIPHSIGIGAISIDYGLDIFYDLVKDGIVEKVSNEN